ncbi:MAG: DUF5371 family protein [Archaeoglobaceae archaeon]
MKKFVNTTTELPEDVLQELKEKSGETSTKEALFKAICHYLYCPYTHDGDKMRLRHYTEHGEGKRKLSGRKPVYLAKIQKNFR